MFKLERRRLMRLLFQILPRNLRFKYLRKAIPISYGDELNHLEFKVADTLEELEAAYSILYDSYVEAGLQKPNAIRMRIIKYFALPTTTTLIAKWDGVVIGTMSIIRKGPFGLPIESIFDLSEIEAGGKTVAEVSSLAIAGKFRNRRGALLLPLCKFFYLYVKKYMHLDRVVIAVNPTWSDFYEGFLDFTALEQHTVVGNYQFANGAPAVGLWSDVTTWEDRFNKLYNSEPDKHNFYKYFIETEMNCIRFPERNYEKAMDPVMTPTMLNYFFRQKSSVFEELTQKEVLALYSYFPVKSYAMVLPKLSENDFRESARFIAHATADIEGGKQVRVLDVSSSGLRVQGPLPRNTNFTLNVKVSDSQTAELVGLIHWIEQENNMYGVQILKADSVWTNYITHLSEDFKSKPSDEALSKKSRRGA